MNNPSARAASRLPDTLLILGSIALVVFLLSYLVPPGSFSYQNAGATGAGAEVVDPGSFTTASEAQGLPLFASGQNPGLFNAVFEGLASGNRGGGSVAIMVFILVVGGAFGILMETGTIRRGVAALTVRRSPKGPGLLATLFLLFSLSGAVFGMGEEAIPFVLMLTPMLHRFGYDSITTLMVTYVATQVGFATSWMNPFSVAVAQGIAGLPLFSGMPLRIGIWCLFSLLALAFTLRYAGQHRREIEHADDPARNEGTLHIADWLIMLGLALTILWIVWGVISAGYYLPEIATQFVVLGTFVGVVSCLFKLDGMTANRAASAFKRGAQDLLPAALVVGLARGIVYLMGGDDPTEPSMLNTMLHASAAAIEGMPNWLAGWLMYLCQSVFNFFVTSGSGQAALTMPIMAPLSDLLGVNRQVAVLAFQLGDGLTNLVVPTSAALMGCLGAAGVDWLIWLRAIKFLVFQLVLLSSTVIIFATLWGYQ